MLHHKIYIIMGNGDIREYGLNTNIKFGRDSQDMNFISLKSKLVSRIHGEFLIEGDEAAVRDLGSSNGMIINDIYYGSDEQFQSKKLEDGDIIRIGDNKIENMREDIVLIIYRYTDNDYCWTYLNLEGLRELYIGRNKEYSDICIRDERVSRKHAIFYLTFNGWLVKDCGSSNGVYLDNNRLNGTGYFRHLSCVQIGDVIFIHRENMLLICALSGCVFVNRRVVNINSSF